MPLNNYREVPIKVNGQYILVSGFGRPNDKDVFSTLKNTHDVDAVISLDTTRKHEGYGEWAKDAGMDPKFYTHGHTEVTDWFKTPFAQTKRIQPEVYDAVFQAVSDAQVAGKKIAIHCGAGDGRTGTALSSLKLRELLEDAYITNPENFDAQQNKTENIHMHYGVIGENEGDVQVTPLVKQAIEDVRKYAVNEDGKREHNNSVESRNDVESLMLYEQHLRNQLVLKHANDNLINPHTHQVHNTFPRATDNPLNNPPHKFEVSGSNFKNLKEQFQNEKGDYLKTKILEDFKSQIEKTTSKDELKELKKEIMKSPEFKVLKKGQDLNLSKLPFADTASEKALKAMFTEQEQNISNTPKQKL